MSRPSPLAASQTTTCLAVLVIVQILVVPMRGAAEHFWSLFVDRLR